MLFRLRLLILVALGVLMAGCRTPQASNAIAANGALAKPAKHSHSQTDADDLFSPALSTLSSTNDPQAEAHAHYAAGIVHEMNGETEQSLNDYFEAARLDPTNEMLILDVSRMFLQASQPGKALEILTRAAASPTASAAVLAQLGFAYSKIGKFEQAAQADRAAIHKDPRSLLGYQTLFLDYLQTKQPQQALGVLDDAAKVKGADGEFLIELAELYFNFAAQNPAQRTNVHARAAAVLQRATKKEISDPQLRLRLADGLNMVGKNGPAAEIYKSLLAEFPDDPPLLGAIRAKLADIYLRNQDATHATEQLEAMLRDNPTDAQAYYLLGSISMDQTNCAQAVDYLTKTLIFKPDFEPAYYDLANAELCANRSEEALSTLEKARQKFQPTFVLDYLTGLAYMHEKKFSQALNHFTLAEITAKTSEPTRLTPEFYFQFGAACERAGDLPQAEKYFEKCLQLSPNFDEAQNYLGFMFAEHGTNLDRARDLIEKALKAEPNNAAYLDSMAWVFFKLNQPKVALDYEQKAIHFSEQEDAEVYDHLGDIYAALGQKDKARDAWKKSVSLEANETVQKKLGDSGAKSAGTSAGKEARPQK